MFQTLIYPSSGARDCSVELPHWSYCSWFDVCWSFGVVGLEWYPCCRLKLQPFFLTGHIMRYFHSFGTIPSTHIFKTSWQVTSLSPFLPLLLNRSASNHVQLLFHFSIYVFPSRRLRHLVVQHSYGNAVCTHIVHSSSLSLLHLAVANASHNIQINFIFACLISGQLCLWFELYLYIIHLLIKCLCFIVSFGKFPFFLLWFKQWSLFLCKYFMCFFAFVLIFLFILSGIYGHYFVASTPLTF